MSTLYKIYCVLCAASRKKYVGLTLRSVEERLKSHIANAGYARNDSSRFPLAIRKYGERQFIVGELETVASLSEAKLREKHYIQLFNTNGSAGYNSTLGGEGSQGWNPTQETRAKMRAAQLGRKASAETRAKMSAASKGKKKSEAHRLNIKHRIISTETRIKSSLTQRGRKVSEDQLERLRRMAKTRPPKHSEETLSKMRGSRKELIQRLRTSLGRSVFTSIPLF